MRLWKVREHTWERSIGRAPRAWGQLDIRRFVAGGGGPSAGAGLCATSGVPALAVSSLVHADAASASVSSSERSLLRSTATRFAAGLAGAEAESGGVIDLPCLLALDGIIAALPSGRAIMGVVSASRVACGRSVEFCLSARALLHGTVTCAARDERSRTAPALRATRRNTRTRQSECLPSAGAAASEVVWMDSGSSGLARPS